MYGLAKKSGKSFEEYMNEMVEQQSGSVAVQAGQDSTYSHGSTRYASAVPSQFSKEDVIVAQGVNAVKQRNIPSASVVHSAPTQPVCRQVLKRRVV